jgi:hypothetical protein
MTITKIGAAVGGLLAAATIALSPVCAGAQMGPNGGPGFEGFPPTSLGPAIGSGPAVGFGAPQASQLAPYYPAAAGTLGVDYDVHVYGVPMGGNGIGVPTRGPGRPLVYGPPMGGNGIGVPQGAEFAASNPYLGPGTNFGPGWDFGVPDVQGGYGVPYSAQQFSNGVPYSAQQFSNGVPGSSGGGQATYPQGSAYGGAAAGQLVWIPMIIGGPNGNEMTLAPVGQNAAAPAGQNASVPAGRNAAAPTEPTGAPLPVMCMVTATNRAVLAQNNAPANSKVAVITNTKEACAAINGTVANPRTASAK